jgi:predicted nuclease of predicted toxin-antitoxin system
MPIRFHLDEYVDPSIANGLRRRGIDVTTTVEAGLLGSDDLEQLAYAPREQRVLFSQDSDFAELAFSGVEHAGIVFCSAGRRTTGEIIQFLELAYEVYSSEEMMGRIEYA